MIKAAGLKPILRTYRKMVRRGRSSVLTTTEAYNKIGWSLHVQNGFLLPRYLANRCFNNLSEAPSCEDSNNRFHLFTATSELHLEAAIVPPVSITLSQRLRRAWPLLCCCPKRFSSYTVNKLRWTNFIKWQRQIAMFPHGVYIKQQVGGKAHSSGDVTKR